MSGNASSDREQLNLFVPLWINQEIAEATASRHLPNDTVRFIKFVTIDRDAASVLAELECKSLEIQIERLPVEAAALLSQFRGNLSISAPEFSDTAVGHLSRHKGPKLRLTGKKFLSDKAAKHLRGYSGFLELPQVASLSTSPAHLDLLEKLLNQPGNMLLHGLEALGNDPLHDQLLTKLLELETIWLDRLLQISESAAETLSTHCGTLKLNGLRSISAAAAAHLSQHRGQIELCGLRGLTRQPGHLALADKLAKTKSKLTRRFKVEYVSDDGAARLSQSATPLNMEELKEFGSGSGHLALADTLAQKGDEITFNQLTRLEPDVAACFSQMRDIHLHGLAELSDETATALTACKARIRLCGVPFVKDSVARILSQHQGIVELPGLTSLPEGDGHAALAAKLARQQEVYLPELRHLSARAASELAKSTYELCLDGLTSLTFELSSILKNHAHTYTGFRDYSIWLGLSKLNNISLSEAAELSEHVHNIRLDGLSYITEEIASMLSLKQKGAISLRGLTSLPSTKGHLALADKLAASATGYLDLGAMTNICNSALERLVGGGYELRLSGLKFLSADAARILSRHGSSLDLNGLVELSDAAANHLSEFPHAIRMTGVSQISERAATSLPLTWRVELDLHKLPLEIAKLRNEVNAQRTRQSGKCWSPWSNEEGTV